MLQSEVLDDADTRILGVLVDDARVSLREIGRSLGISTNSVKARINGLISRGVIEYSSTLVNPALFGFTKVFHVALRDITISNTTRRALGLLGEMIYERRCVGGTTWYGIATKEEDEMKVLQHGDIYRVFTQRTTIGQPFDAKEPGDVDLEIVKSLLSNPRAGIHEIAEKSSLSPKTVGKRLATLRDSGALRFVVETNPEKSGLLRGSLNVTQLPGTQIITPHSAKEILQGSSCHFLAFLRRNDVTGIGFFAKSIFAIDKAREAFQSIEGVFSTEVFVTAPTKYYQDWILSEIAVRTGRERVH